MAPEIDVDAVRTRWIRACVSGELIGFVPPALTGVVLVMLDVHESVLVFGLVAAGLGEGVVLGIAQSTVMRDVLPNVSGWVAATTLAAGLAWLVPVTTLAWLIGVTIPVVALSVVPNGWPAAAHVVVGLTAAIAMGATVGAITGSTLEQFARQRAAPSDLVGVGQDSAVGS